MTYQQGNSQPPKTEGNNFQFLMKTQAVMQLSKENSCTLTPATNQWKMPFEQRGPCSVTCCPGTQKIHRPFSKAGVASNNCSYVLAREAVCTYTPTVAPTVLKKHQSSPGGCSNLKQVTGCRDLRFRQRMLWELNSSSYSLSC